ncbi:MAG: 30S ribosomal protein S6 [Parcubacteria group bacterium Athens0714_25]|nr:MAG: 30S ribosomal protein S6 [Parcubacteria group bacterium Athens0714_25]
MIEYELFYLVGESREHDLDKIKKEVDEVVSGEGGKILEVEVVTRRKMSYEIKKESRGVYVAKRFEILDKDEREEKDIPNKDIVAEINTKLLQNRDILRFIITRADQLPELKAETKKEEKSGHKKESIS